MKNVLLLTFVTLSAHLVEAQDAVKYYVNTMAPIAIVEMERTGIPASIKLAQGVLESNSGRSAMALTANNHFGIKCGNSWNGQVYYRKDDDKDHRGRLIESCFRTYNTVEDSYVAHSDFLMNNGKSSRYEFLFEYDNTDYKRWAKGLSKAGYATDPKYPQKLINLIEKYELYRYDDMGSAHNDHIVFESSDQKKPSVVKTSGGRILNDKNARNSSGIKNIPRYKYHNDVKMVLTSGSESLDGIASHYNLDVAALMNYNDLDLSPYEPLPAKSRIYIEKKKLSYKGKRKFHQIREGERMKHIAQQYAIDLEALYIRNRMPFGSEPRPGERIQLKGLLRTGKRPKLSSKGKSSIAEKSRFVEETVEYIFTPKHADRD